jgi:hypothetical protein
MAQQRSGGFFRLVGMGCVGCAGLAALGVLAVIVLGAIGSRTAAAPSVATTTAQSQPAAEPTAIPKVGDTVSQGNWAYQVSKVDRQKDVTWTSFGSKRRESGRSSS